MSDEKRPKTDSEKIVDLATATVMCLEALWVLGAVFAIAGMASASLYQVPPNGWFIALLVEALVSKVLRSMGFERVVYRGSVVITIFAVFLLMINTLFPVLQLHTLVLAVAFLGFGMQVILLDIKTILAVEV